MPDWTVCPHCQLRHSRRPDDICPRCKAALAPPPSPVAAQAGRSPQDPGPLPDVFDGRPLGGPVLSAATRAGDDGVATGGRIAGALLLANGLALMVEKGLAVTMAEAAQPAGFQPSPISMLIDLVLGGMLLTGNPKGLPWAKVRVVLGGLLLPALFFGRGEVLLGALQLAFSGGMAMLLFGNAGRLRIAIGLLATGPVLALETLGLLGVATGTAPLAQLQMAGTLEDDAIDSVEGVACAWRLAPSGGPWHLRDAEAAHKDNPLADRWLVWPSRDAHVMVIVERLDPGLVVDMGRFADVVLGNARETAPDLRVISRDDLHAGGALIHTQGTYDGLAIESYYGLFASEPYIFQVVAFTEQRQFAAVEAHLRSAIDSFEAPPS